MTLKRSFAYLSVVLSDYEKSHQDYRNKITHAIGIPLIAVSLPVFFFSFNAGLMCFVLGWGLQFLGHVFEGKRPSFFSNLKHLASGLLWFLRQLFRPQKASLSLVAWLSVFLCFLLLRFAMLGAESTINPPKLSSGQELLVPCPETPNCAKDALPLEKGSQASLVKMAEILREMGGEITMLEDSLYLRAEFKSFLFSFTDDLEVMAGAESLQLRSSSRVGHSDLGVNQRRLEEIKKRWSSAK